jgi:hypothetical protein
MSRIVGLFAGNCMRSKSKVRIAAWARLASTSTTNILKHELETLPGMSRKNHRQKRNAVGFILVLEDSLCSPASHAQKGNKGMKIIHTNQLTSFLFIYYYLLFVHFPVRLMVRVP